MCTEIENEIDMICGNCELFETLDCPYICAVNELTHFEFLPCYAFTKND